MNQMHRRISNYFTRCKMANECSNLIFCHDWVTPSRILLLKFYPKSTRFYCLSKGATTPAAGSRNGWPPLVQERPRSPHGWHKGWRQIPVAGPYFLAWYRGTSPGNENFSVHLSQRAHLRRLPPPARPPEDSPCAQHRRLALTASVSAQTESPSPHRQSPAPPPCFPDPPTFVESATAALKEATSGCPSEKHPATTGQFFFAAGTFPAVRHLPRNQSRTSCSRAREFDLHAVWELIFWFCSLPSANCHRAEFYLASCLS